VMGGAFLSFPPSPLSVFTPTSQKASEVFDGKPRALPLCDSGRRTSQAAESTAQQGEMSDGSGLCSLCGFFGRFDLVCARRTNKVAVLP